MKLNKMRVISLAACLIFIFIFTGSYAQDLEDFDVMSLSIDVDLEIGQGDSDRFLLSNNPIIIIMELANFSDKKEEVLWTIYQDKLMQTEVNTYENNADELPQNYVSYEIREDGTVIKDLTDKLKNIWIQIITVRENEVAKIKLDAYADTEVLLPNCSVKEPKLVKEDGKVTLVGFGLFQESRREARKGRNPQTGETIQIKAKNVVHFKPGKKLNDAL